MSHWENNEEIKIFREYLRIPSVHPNIDYGECVLLIRKLAEEIGLHFEFTTPAAHDKPTVILSWIGTQPKLPSIMLNSHMDVVPVYEEFWTHKPFDADIDADGKIFARGTQDMKSVGMQYLAAIRRLKKSGKKLKRTIHVSYVPGEEVFDPEGMRAFLASKVFKRLNVGFSCDEGSASPTEAFNVFYGERVCWQLLYKVHGQPGHGAGLFKNTAGEKLRNLLNKIYDYRSSQEKILEDDPTLLLGDVTSINATIIKGGTQENVIPPLYEVSVDIRLAVTVDHEKFEELTRGWAKDSGDNIEVIFTTKETHCAPTAIDDSNIYWNAFKSAMDEMNLKIQPQICPGSTDSSFIRAAGIKAIGFSPMNHTPILLHDHDEYLHADVYLKGIDIYEKLIERIANVDG